MRRDVKKQQAAKGSIRIISGQWKGRKLPVLTAEGLRPTTDRTKETLFNWLMPYIKDRACLDLFAGSGSLGFEALSRHAGSVIFVEKHKQAADILRQNLHLLKDTESATHVIQGDATEVITRLEGKFDLIFLDPPFHQNLLPGIIDKLSVNQLLNVGCLIYIETELLLTQIAIPQQWRLLKQSQTKQFSYRLFMYDPEL
jgi:16S rRNA (guanine966-N2)-methyltransferase